MRLAVRRGGRSAPCSTPAKWTGACGPSAPRDADGADRSPLGLSAKKAETITTTVISAENSATRSDAVLREIESDKKAQTPHS